MLIIFWGILMFDQIFLSPHMKRSMIISNKHGMSKLPHELPNDSKYSILKIMKYQENLKSSQNYSLVLSLLPTKKFCRYQQKSPQKQKLNLFRITLFHMKTKVYLKYFVNDSLGKQCFTPNFSHTPLNLIYSNTLGTRRLLTQF